MGAGARATIFNIQPFSIHDGPGIRTTVFLKGCPLRCLWCQNPESQSARRELFFFAEKCVGCGKCVAVCPHGAISLRDGRSVTDRLRCEGHGACVAVCPSGARELVGAEQAIDAVLDRILADRMFYQDSGGVTLSGGEPLFQADIAAELLRRCQAAGLHTTVDTSGYATWPIVEHVLSHANLVLYDLKHMDPEAHLRLTGVANTLILDNARRIYHELGVAMRARTSIVPGCNDTVANIAATARFIATELSPAVPYDLLPYHSYGEGKQERLEWPDERLFANRPPDADHLAELKQAAEAEGLTVQIGG